MTQKELIRQKIEELKKTLEESNYYLDNSQQALGYSLALDDFKEFIDSLPEEKPSEDFPTSDEEMAKFLATHPEMEVPEKYKTPNWLFDKQPSEDLKEAAEISFDEARALTEDYRDFLAKGLTENRPRPIGPHWFCEYAKNRFIAGAEWALNQGVKATGMISPRGIIYDNNIGYRLFLERYHNGDKVEVQVRKLEENGK